VLYISPAKQDVIYASIASSMKTGSVNSNYLFFSACNVHVSAELQEISRCILYSYLMTMLVYLSSSFLLDIPGKPMFASLVGLTGLFLKLASVIDLNGFKIQAKNVSLCK